MNIAEPIFPLGDDNEIIKTHRHNLLYFCERDKLLRDDSNCKVIMVHRDMKDVITTRYKYLIEKSKKEKSTLRDLDEYIKLSMNQYEKRILDIKAYELTRKVLHISFEQLVFNFDFIMSKVGNFLGIDVNNTSVFESLTFIRNSNILFVGTENYMSCERVIYEHKELLSKDQVIYINGVLVKCGFFI
jgi:hypothetical protein